jgi:hypothetical protein
MHIITLHFPDWLRNPIQQESTEGARQAAAEARNWKKFSNIAQEQRRTMDKIVNQLPEPPKIQEEEEPIPVPQPIEQVAAGAGRTEFK